MANVKKEVVRGFLISDQYLAQRRLSELTIGQSYLIGKYWLEYKGKVGKKNRFSSFKLIVGKHSPE